MDPSNHWGSIYYARDVDNKLLVALRSIIAQQAAATETTSDPIKQLLDYVATYPNDNILYCASDMILAANYGARFYNEPKGCSHAGDHTFLYENAPDPRRNGPVLIIFQNIKFLMTSVSESELVDLFINAKETTKYPLRITLTLRLTPWFSNGSKQSLGISCIMHAPLTTIS